VILLFDLAFADRQTTDGQITSYHKRDRTTQYGRLNNWSHPMYLSIIGSSRLVAMHRRAAANLVQCGMNAESDL